MAQGLPGSLRAGGQRVVRSFAKSPADRVDRRQVKNVEAHLRDVAQPGLDIAKRAVAACDRRRRPRKHLVPRPESRPLPLDHDAERPIICNTPAPVGIPRHPLDQVLLQARPYPRFLALLTRQNPGLLAQPVGIGAVGALGRLEDVLAPLQKLAGEVLLTSLVLLDQLLVPGEIAIDPGLDRVLVPSLSRHQ